MRMLLGFLFGLFLLAGSAQATPVLLGEIFHDYGAAAGQLDPLGSDALAADYVSVSDQSASRFADLFDFHALDFASIAYFRLTLSVSHTGNLLEFWTMRPGQSADLQWITSGSGSSKGTQGFIIDSTTDSFTTAVDSGVFSLWFAELGPFAQSFRLYDATLAVYGEPAQNVAEPGMLALLGLSLTAALWMRRRRR